MENEREGNKGNAREAMEDRIHDDFRCEESMCEDMWNRKYLPDWLKFSSGS